MTPRIERLNLSGSPTLAVQCFCDPGLQGVVFRITGRNYKERAVLPERRVKRTVQIIVTETRADFRVRAVNSINTPDTCKLRVNIADQMISTCSYIIDFEQKSRSEVTLKTEIPRGAAKHLEFLLKDIVPACREQNDRQLV